MATRCAQCDARTASWTSPTGRPLCEACFAQLTGLAGAGTSMASGAGPASAVGAGIAASGFAGATADDAAARADRARRLREADGFWQRMRIRIIG